MRLSIFLAACGTALFASHAGAATITSSFFQGGSGVCAGVTADSNGVVTCATSFDSGGSGNLVQVSMQTREDFGNIGVSAHLTISDNSPGANTPAGHQQWESDIRYADTLGFGVTSGTFVLPFDIAGTVFAPEPGYDPISGQSAGPSQARVNAWVGSNGVYQTVYQELHQGRVGVLDDFNHPAEAIGNHGITNLLLPIVNGQIALEVGINTTVWCFNSIADNAATCQASADFLNSLRVLGGTVLDDSGQAVQNPTVSSASGFDYLTGAPPHEAAIPLPGALPLMLAGLGVFGMAAAKRRAAR